MGIFRLVQLAEIYSDGINTYVYLDTYYRLYSDKVDYNIHKNSATLSQFGYDATTLRNTLTMNSVDILALIDTKVSS